MPSPRYALRRFLLSAVNRLVPVASYDSNRTMREFSIGISNITELSSLATVAIGLISEAVEIQRGYLFIVEYDAHPTNSTYRLEGMGGMGQVPEESRTCVLNANSPIAKYFRHSRQPIQLHTMTSSPQFAQASEEEQNWLKNLEMEAFVSVQTRDEWIGLIALGAKNSGAAYYDDDLLMIGTLADQLSLALQNARLISSLMRVNNDFRRAYSSMEQSNRQLQQAITQLEKMDQTKSDFISVASHELRTPLTVMRGYNEMLLDDPTIKANPMHLKMLQGIHSGMIRLHEIVESMLDVASIDSRSLALHKQPVSINYLITSVCGGLKAALEERNLKLTLENLRDLPTVDADSEAISKVFHQVIINAIKYTPDGGSITITGVPVSNGHLDQECSAVEVIVSDTGIGIAAENLELIFKKFFQTSKVSLHSTGKTKFKGAGPGLGLAIAKGIVEAHGGKIWAVSAGIDEDKYPGSQFHITLPLHGNPSS